MQRILQTLLFWTLVLCACGTGISPAGVPPQTETTSAVDIPTASTSPTETCGYQWAQKDLPELSSDFQQSIQGLQPEAQANAFAFGENCVYADGNTTFSAMETDFNVTLQINDLSNQSDLGGWIVAIMQVIEKIPQDQIVGPRPGRVSINFQSNGEQKFVNFYVDQYKALPSNLNNSEIYQALQIPQ